MKSLLWVGLLFLSISWLFFIPIFIPPDWKMGLIFLIIGLTCNVFAFWKNRTFKVNRKYFLFLLPLLVSLLVVGFPYNLGVIVLIIGGVTYFLLVHLLKYERFGWISLGLSFSGLILTVQTAMLPFYFIFASHYHRVDFFSPFVSSFGRLFGLHTSVSNGIVFVQTVAQTYPFTTTLEKLGFFPWFMIFIGALSIFFFYPKIKDVGKKIFLFLILSGIYLVLRYLFLIFVFTTIKPSNLDIFWDATYMFISFFPFVLLLACFIPLKKLPIDINCFKKFAIDKKRVLAMIMIFIFIFSVIGAYAYQDPGIKKNGRILIDELHSDWEDSSRKMDKEWYGKLSTYNAYSLAEWLNYYYHVDRNMNNTLNSSLLENYDILIIKCPTNRFSDEEIDAIVTFVEDGGGLYFVGDHTNVFGMNFYLNQISERFGIIFRYDSTHDLKTRKLSVYEPPTLFAHPIVQFTAHFNYLSSCTLDVPLNAENVMIGYGLTSAMGTYSTEYFFRPSASTEPDVEQGLFVQTAAVKYGKGRVVAFTDSTCISNFCIFMDGYPPSNLITMEYLNRSNLYSYVNNIFVVMAIISLFLVSYLLWKEKKVKVVFMFTVVGLLSFSVATPLFSYMNYVNYSLPEPHSDFTRVCFVEDYSDFVISSRTASMSVSWEKTFNTFFIWTQRVDCVPSVEETLGDALKKGDAVVIINPVKTFGEKEIEDIKEYIENGGNILLMDGISNTDSTANELLYHFDVRIDVQEEGNDSASGLSISGSNTTFFVENNHTSIAVTNIGDGKLVVVVDSRKFSNSVMGGAFTVPNDYQMEIYNVEFDLFENIMFDE